MPRRALWSLSIAACLAVGSVASHATGRDATTTVRVVYEQAHTAAVLPLADVRVTARAASGARLEETWTDAEGLAQVACADPDDRVTVRVSTAGRGPVRVRYDPAGWLPYNERATAAVGEGLACGRAHTLVANAALANTLVAMRAIAALYEDRFGYARGPVDVFVNRGGRNGLYSLYNNISFGEDGLDTPRGFRMMAHEYAHAFHHRALGGMPRGRCGRSHYFAGADDLGCAYTEGFAHFASAVAMAELFPTLYGLSPLQSRTYLHIVNNTAYPGRPEYSDRPDYVADGAVIEGAVAAFLWDLYDPPGTVGENAAAEAAFDRTSYPLRYLADVVATCQWEAGGRARAEDGVDRLIACFEGRVPPYSERLFRLRFEEGPAATDYRPAERAAEPPGWNPDDVARLWRHTFYGLAADP